MYKALLVLGFCFCLATAANAQPASGYSGSGYAAPGYGGGTPATEVYRNDRFGFQLSYPSAVFAPGEAPEGGQGMVFTSRDGAAQLLVSAGPNTTGETLGIISPLCLEQDLRRCARRVCARAQLVVRALGHQRRYHVL